MGRSTWTSDISPERPGGRPITDRTVQELRLARCCSQLESDRNDSTPVAGRAGAAGCPAARHFLPRPERLCCSTTPSGTIARLTPFHTPLQTTDMKSNMTNIRGGDPVNDLPCLLRIRDEYHHYDPPSVVSEIIPSYPTPERGTRWKPDRGEWGTSVGSDPNCSDWARSLLLDGDERRRRTSTMTGLLVARAT